MKLYIASCQYNVSGGRKLLRELSILPVNNPLQPRTWLCKATIPFDSLSYKDQTTNNYITRNLHGLHWLDGDSSPSDIQTAMCMKNPMLILCNDLQIKEILEDVFPNSKVIAIQLPSLTKEVMPYPFITCPFHHSKTFCSLVNVYKMYHLLIE